jgi:hypothetical protein
MLPSSFQNTGYMKPPVQMNPTGKGLEFWGQSLIIDYKLGALKRAEDDAGGVMPPTLSAENQSAASLILIPKEVENYRRQCRGR